ncbi:hypothetical protein EYC84_001337 [Monilinia fructicola]|uniref:Uncharacterized protein n=1 Tax=Monilinia fructicola TaxID=38448 RepID=A0A5M9JJW1_MONFR|nr:hypothetical protein EYC84_001337 [Monilinia fructicola]
MFGISYRQSNHRKTQICERKKGTYEYCSRIRCGRTGFIVEPTASSVFCVLHTARLYQTGRNIESATQISLKRNGTVFT